MHKSKLHFLGQKNANSQYYLVRNCNFEPTEDKTTDCLRKTLKEINKAFLWNTPAIISSHRINYIGWIEESNRMKNLLLLDELLTEVLKNWPEVEFLTSDELGDIISDENK